MIHRRFILESRLAEPIRGDLRLPEGAGPHPVVVCCHGFKGFKDWGFHPWLGTTLAEAGLAALHFNFSRNGVRAADGDLEDLDAFASNTLSIERDDLDVVLDAVVSGGLDTTLDPSRVGLLGHSRGGGTVLLGASERRDIKALVTWAAVSHFDRIRDEATLAEWRAAGALHVVNSRTGQVLPMGVAFLDDVLANLARLDLHAAAARLEAPWLLVHGRADETVPFAEAESLLAAAKGSARLRAIEGGGHTFGAGHPFAGPTPHLADAAEATVAHLRAALAG